MAIYDIAYPDGRKFSIEGPSGASEAEVLAAIDRRLNRSKPEPAPQLREVPRYYDDPGFWDNLFSGLKSGAIGAAELTALGIGGAMLGEQNELKYREAVQEWAKRNQPDAGREFDPESVTMQLGQGLGSLGVFAPAAIAAAFNAPLGLGLAAATGVGLEAGEASERARRAGTDEATRNAAMLKSVPVGLSQVLPLGRIAKGLRVPFLKDLQEQVGPQAVKGVRDRVKKMLINSAKTGSFEGIQEGLANEAQNLIERGYNPEKMLGEGTLQESTLGVGVGAIAQLLADTFIPGRFVRQSDSKELAIRDEDMPTPKPQRPTPLVPAPEEQEQEQLALPQPQLALPPPQLRLPSPDAPVTLRVSRETGDIITIEDKDFDESKTSGVGREPDTVTLTGAQYREMLQRQATEVRNEQEAREVQERADRYAELMSRKQRRAIDVTNAQDAQTRAQNIPYQRGEQQNLYGRFDRPQTQRPEPEQGTLDIETPQDNQGELFGPRGGIRRDRQNLAPTPEPRSPQQGVLPGVEINPDETQGQQQGNLLGPRGGARNVRNPDLAPRGEMAPTNLAPVTAAELDAIGLPKSTPVRKQILETGENINSEPVRQMLADYAAKPKVSPSVKRAITNFLQSAPQTQQTIFDGQSAGGSGSAPNAPRVVPPNAGDAASPSGGGVSPDQSPDRDGGTDRPGDAGGTAAQSGSGAVATSVDDAGVTVSGEGRSDAPVAPTSASGEGRSDAPVAPTPAAPQSAAKTASNAEVDAQLQQVGRRSKPAVTARPTPRGPVAPSDPADVAENPLQEFRRNLTEANRQVQEETDEAPTPRKKGEERGVAFDARRLYKPAPPPGPTAGESSEARAESNKTVEKKWGESSAKKTRNRPAARRRKPVTPEQESRKGRAVFEYPFNKGDTNKLTAVQRMTDNNLQGDVKKALRALNRYLRQYPSYAKAMDALIWDMLEYQEFKDVKGITPGGKTYVNKGDPQWLADMRKGTGGPQAEAAIAWLRGNLSVEGQKMINNRIDAWAYEYKQLNSNLFADENVDAAIKKNRLAMERALERALNLTPASQLGAAFKQITGQLDDMYQQAIAAKQYEAAKMLEDAKAEIKTLYKFRNAKGSNLTPDRLESVFDRWLEDVAALSSLANLKDANPEMLSGVPVSPHTNAYLERGDLKGALEDIGRTNANPVLRRVANLLAKRIGDTKVNLVEYGTLMVNGQLASGAYDTTTDSIRLERAETTNTARTIDLLHEVTHALTYQAIRANPSLPAVKRLHRMYKEMRDNPETKAEMDLFNATNLDEFIAQAFTNPRFQDRVNQMFTKSNTDKTVWQRIVDFIRSVLGMKNETVSLVESILRAPVKSEGGEAVLGGALPNLKAGGAIKDAANSYFDNVKYNYQMRMGQTKAYPKVGWLRTISRFFDTAPKAIHDGVARMMPMIALADFGMWLGTDSVKRLHKAFEQQSARINQGSKNIDATLKGFTKELSKLPPEVADRIQVMATMQSFWNVNLHKSDTREKIQDEIKNSRGDTRDHNKARLKFYDENVAEWKELDRKHGAQRIMAPVYNMYRAFFAKTEKGLDKRIRKLAGDNEALYQKLKKEYIDKLFDRAIDPYLPLSRGEHADLWVAYTMPGKDGESAQRFYEAFDSDSQRQQYIDHLEKDYGIPRSKVDQYTDIQTMIRRGGGPADIIDSLRTLVKNGVPDVKDADLNAQRKIEDERQRILEDLSEAYIRLLPQSSFAKQFKTRSEEKYGFITDVKMAARDKAYSLSRYVANIETTPEIEGIATDLDADLKRITRENPDRTRNAQVLSDEIGKRIDFALHPPQDMLNRVVRQGNRFAFLYTMGGNVSSAVVNMAQIPFVVAPYLIGKTGVNRADVMGYIGLGYRLFGNAPNTGLAARFGQKDGDVEFEQLGLEKNPLGKGIDHFYKIDTNGQMSLRDDVEGLNEKVYNNRTMRDVLMEMLPIMQAASDRGLLQNSLFYDSLGHDESGAKKTLWDRTSALGATFFHNAERMNRQVALVASFMAAKKSLQAQNPSLTGEALTEQAIEMALRDTQLTNGGAILTTATGFGQTGIGRMAMMFRTFGVQMYYTQANLLKRSLDAEGATKEQRKEARTQLLYLQGITALASGVQGLTIVGIAEMIHDLFKDDDELDGRTKLRNFFGEELYYGGVNQATRALTGGEGVNLSTRIGLSNMLFQVNRYNDGGFWDSPEKKIGEEFGGPAWSIIKRFARGVSDLNEGEYQRGFEQLVPSSIANMSKFQRYMDEGALTRRGDKVVGDMGAGLLAAQFLGFAPAEYVRNQETSAALKSVSEATRSKRTQLMRRYYIAMRFNDSGAMRDTYKEIQKFNQKHRENRIGLDTLRRSIRGHMETSATMVNGVTFSKQERDFYRQMARELNEGNYLFR